LLIILQTRFFAAEVVMAFEYLHNLDIMHRDLKPENMLIDWRGHCKLTDFGFAKRVDHATYTMCGTPEYLAPEIIANKGYTRAVDWWAVGVLIFEMRKGRSPFEDKEQMNMFRKITKCEFKFPRNFSEPERQLIMGFLQVDITRRLGYMHGGAARIKREPYFEGLDWNRLARQKYQSPFKPGVQGEADASKFDAIPRGKAVTWQPGKDKYDATFDNF
jgi:protein kinase A